MFLTKQTEGDFYWSYSDWHRSLPSESNLTGGKRTHSLLVVHRKLSPFCRSRRSVQISAPVEWEAILECSVFIMRRITAGCMWSVLNMWQNLSYSMNLLRLELPRLNWIAMLAGFLRYVSFTLHSINFPAFSFSRARSLGSETSKLSRTSLAHMDDYYACYKFPSVLSNICSWVHL